MWITVVKKVRDGHNQSTIVGLCENKDLQIVGARKRTRTSTPLRELAPEASASANSAIRAHQRVMRGKSIVPANGSVCQRDGPRGQRRRQTIELGGRAEMSK